MQKTGDLLTDLLLEWEEQWEKGIDLSAEELAGSETYLVERLRAKIAALKATNWIMARVLTDGKEATGGMQRQKNC